MSITDIEKDLVESLGEQMQKTMDFEIIADIMVSMRGYVRIEVKYGSHQKWFEVKEWAEQNCTGEHQEHNGTWLFEQPKDATMFKLRWS